jgi:flagellar hook-associated protein 2
MATISNTTFSPTLSSPGVGSGLDVNGIVSKLVALEQQPLQRLQQQASGMQAQLSAFGQITSQVSNLQDQLTKLTAASNWGAMTLSSSNAGAVSGTADTGSVAGTFSISVGQLSRSQAAASAAITTGSAPGTGTLTIDIGSWSGSTFTPKSGGASAVVTITADDNTMAKVAAKINAANAGVSATVITDASGDRLLMRSTATGVASGFRVQVADDNAANTPANNGGLFKLGYDPGNAVAFGMALSQSALDAQATINGVPVSSPNNTLSGTVSGLTLQLNQVTTSPVDITVAADTASATANINAFVSSYNAISGALAEMTKYDAAKKTAGTLQGDSTAVNLLSALRRLVGGPGPAGNAFGRLSDLGVQFQSDGSLSVNSAKLSTALTTNYAAVQKFFSATGSTASTQGLAVQAVNFTKGLLDVSGTLSSKSGSIQKLIARNTDDQTRVTNHASQVEAQLKAQYAKLDANMAQLNSLSSYVSQQVTTWNKQTN